MPKRRFSDEIEREMVALYQAGMTSTEVGDRFGCNYATVISALHRNGIAGRGRGKGQSVALRR
ncbi:MAG: hypothetical protein ACM3NQ_04270, partial [Bacteroidales bacterium]